MDKILAVLCDPAQMMAYKCRGREEELLSAVISSDSTMVQGEINKNDTQTQTLPRILARLEGIHADESLSVKRGGWMGCIDQAIRKMLYDRQTTPTLHEGRSFSIWCDNEGVVGTKPVKSSATRKGMTAMSADAKMNAEVAAVTLAEFPRIPGIMRCWKGKRGESLSTPVLPRKGTT